MKKGYKVFNPDWTCEGKQYTCPGKFEEDVEPSVCVAGMHFCERAVDCFNYYAFSPENKVAEVIAYGDVKVDGECATNKLEIVREIPWVELLTIVNTGHGCTGLANSGNGNSGNGNSGDRNSGNWNSGDMNSGNWNSGNWNSGDMNSGDMNSGDRNSGNWNSGNGNSGNYNSGNYNSGDMNSGDMNSGDRNSGNWNSGDRNSGDWNNTSFSAGCFCTKETNIMLFDRPSDWTMRDWLASDARKVLMDMPDREGRVEYVTFRYMTEQEKAEHPEAETTGGFLKEIKNAERAVWWKSLKADEKETIMAIPNFDKEIFKAITGVDVDNG